MYYKDFYGKQHSALGLGGIHLPLEEGNPNRVDRVKGQEIVDHLMANGVNVFDSGYFYYNGDSERFYGEALQKYPRESYTLSTKFSVSANPDVEAVLLVSLEHSKRCAIFVVFTHTTLTL